MLKSITTALSKVLPVVGDEGFVVVLYMPRVCYYIGLTLTLGYLGFLIGLAPVVRYEAVLIAVFCIIFQLSLWRLLPCERRNIKWEGEKVLKRRCGGLYELNEDTGSTAAPEPFAAASENEPSK